MLQDKSVLVEGSPLVECSKFGRFQLVGDHGRMNSFQILGAQPTHYAVPSLYCALTWDTEVGT